MRGKKISLQNIYKTYKITVCPELSNLVNYYRSGNIREVLIFANFERRTNSRTQQYRENNYGDTKEK